jgi:hypothetical protein
MRWILFIARVAFICNLCSLFIILILFQENAENNAAQSSIIVMGYVLALIFNPLSNLLNLFALIFQKTAFQQLPKWLVVSNFVFLLLQLQYIIFK